MALFKDTNDFKAHAPNISRHYAWANDLKPKVNHIARLRLWPYISEAAYTELENIYLTGAPSTQQAKLLTYLQPAEAYYTYMHLLSVDRLSISEMGVIELRSDDGTSSPASFHAIADVKEEIAEMAYSFMDQALAYMESEKATFTIWANSAAYTKIKSVFVWNTDVLNKYVNAGNSRHTFLSIRNELQAVQEEQIRPQLGDIFCDDLLAKLKANTLSDDELKVVERIQMWQSREGLAKAIATHRVKLFDGALFLRSNLDGPERKSDPTAGAIRDLRLNLESQAKAAQTRLISYLDANADTFINYTPSTLTDSDGEPCFRRPYKGTRNSFRV